MAKKRSKPNKGIVASIGRRKLSFPAWQVFLFMALFGALGLYLLATTFASTRQTNSDACGALISKATGGTWRCTFVDHFSGSALDPTKWSALTSASSAREIAECRVDSPNNISVAFGHLRLAVRKLDQPMECKYMGGTYTTSYTAGAVSTGRKFSQTYGRYEIRAKFPSTTESGLHSAIWLWPQERKYGSASGEIDIAEFRTAVPDRAVPSLHYVDEATGKRVTKTNNTDCLISKPGEFHTYAVEWTSSKFTFIYDGKACWTHSWKPASPLVAPAPFDEPYFVILNQSRANVTSGFNAFTSETPLPSKMVVDYVKVWQ